MGTESHISGQYAHGHQTSVLASHGIRTAENSCDYLLPHLRPGQRLLDVGCGPGSITVDLAARVAPGEVLGIEPVIAPLEAARELAKQRNSTARFEQADVYALPYADHTFDVTHAHQVLQHLSDPVAALREMGRVTRPDGLVAVRDVDYRVMTWFPASEGLTRWLQLYREIAKDIGGQPDAGCHLKSWAGAAGLQEVEFSTSTWTYATPESTSWWGTSQAERVLQSNFATHAAERGVTQAQLQEISDAWLRWSEDPDGCFVMVHGELLARP